MAYKLEGRLLEVCNCNVLCPCWIGEDPDNGTCESTLAYHIDQGMIDDVDVSGLTLAVAVLIPGNVLNGNFKQCVYISEEASDEQFEALLKGFGGKLGGPLKDLADLVGEVVEVKRSPISFEVTEGRGRYTVGDFIEADMEPYKGPTGEPTTLVESVFSTIPGSPAYIAKAQTFKMDSPQLGLKVDLKDHNAIQGTFLFEA
jgi:hypothetical protein